MCWQQYIHTPWYTLESGQTNVPAHMCWQQDIRTPWCTPQEIMSKTESKEDSPMVHHQKTEAAGEAEGRRTKDVDVVGNNEERSSVSADVAER